MRKNTLKLLIYIELCFIFSFIVVISSLLIIEKYYSETEETVGSYIESGDIAANPPDGAKFLSFSPDGNYYSYVDGSTIYVLKTDDNSVVRKIENSAPVEYAFTLNDRNIIMYLTYEKSPSTPYPAFAPQDDTSVSPGPESPTPLPTSDPTPSFSPNPEDVIPSENSHGNLPGKTPETSSSPVVSSEPANTPSPFPTPSASSKSTSKSTPKTKYVKTGSGLCIYTYNIDQDSLQLHKSFNVPGFKSVKHVEYSSLTNLIYINAETSSTDRIYRIDIMKNVSSYGNGKSIQNMVLLNNSDVLYYEENDGIYKNNDRFRLFGSEKVRLLGANQKDRVYFQSLDEPEKIYAVYNDKIEETFTVNPDFNKAAGNRKDVFLIYNDHLLDLTSKRKTDFKDGGDFIGIFGDGLYVKLKNGKINVKDLY